jgi:hypothetical protein
MDMGGVRTHVAPGDVIAAAKQMKHRQRVTTCSNYAELEEKLNERRKQFVPDG